MKQILFETINAVLAQPRGRYEELIADPGYIEATLRKGARRAREYSVPILEEIRKAVGIRAIGG
jgi:tryptophanyl-tRNA synthetase